MSDASVKFGPMLSGLLLTGKWVTLFKPAKDLEHCRIRSRVWFEDPTEILVHNILTVKELICWQLYYGIWISFSHRKFHTPIIL